MCGVVDQRRMLLLAWGIFNLTMQAESVTKKQRGLLRQHRIMLEDQLTPALQAAIAKRQRVAERRTEEAQIREEQGIVDGIAGAGPVEVERLC